MSFDVLKAGLSDTVQDGGRPGYYHLGLPPSGAMDMRAYHISNALVGNPQDAAALEMTYLGPTLRATDDMLAAFAGADMQATLDDLRVPCWTTFLWPADTVLQFRSASAGARAYLSIAGGIDVPARFGSRSTYLLASIGGLNGRKLMKGDHVPSFPKDATRIPSAQPIELATDPHLVSEDAMTLSFTPGPGWDRLTEASRTLFVDNVWMVSTQADRVGYRLEGPTLEFVGGAPRFGAGDDPSNVVDGPYPIGGVHVPSGARPIVVFRDAVTAGGYETVATIVSTDMDRLAQVRTNQTVRLQQVSLDRALDIRLERNAWLQGIITAIGQNGGRS